MIGLLALLAMIGAAVLTPIRVLRGAKSSHFAVAAGIVSATAVVCVATATTMLLEGNTAAFPFWFLLGLGSLNRPRARTAALEGSATPSENDPEVEPERAATDVLEIELDALREAETSPTPRLPQPGQAGQTDSRGNCHGSYSSTS